MKNIIRNTFIAVSLAAASGATLAKPQVRQAERALARSSYTESVSARAHHLDRDAEGTLTLQERKAAQLEHKERRLQRKGHPRHHDDATDLV